MWLLLPLVSAGWLLGVSAVAATGVARAPWMPVVAAACGVAALVARPRRASAPALFVAALAASTWLSAAPPPAQAPLPADEVLWMLRVRDARPSTSPTTVTATVLGTQPLGAMNGSWLAPRPSPTVVVPRVEAAWTPRCGDVVLVRGRFRVPESALHRFAFDGEAWAARAGIAGWVAPGGEFVRVRRGQGPCTWVDEVRVRVERALLAHASEASVGVLLAMTTGTRNAVEPEVRERFAANGAAHVLAVSGMHLGLLCAAAFWLIERAVRRVEWITLRWGARRGGAVLTLPLVAGYVVLTGASASAVRAGLMTGAMLVAVISGRRGASVHALWAAVWFMLAVRPSWIADIGFQLSVMATASLVFAIAPERAPGRRSWAARMAHSVVANARVSTIASLATTPALLYHFGATPLASTLTNLVVVPVLTLVALPLAAAGGLLCAAGFEPASTLIVGAGHATELALRIAEWSAPWLEASLTWGRPSLFGLVGWSLIALSAPFVSRSTWRWHTPMWGVALALLATDLPPWLRPPSTTRIHAIPVGQGDCTLVQLAGGGTILIDAGGSAASRRSIGTTLVLPYLRGIGVDRVDTLVVTHPDIDHAGGMPALVAPLRPREVLVGAGEHAEVFRALRAEADRAGAAWQPLFVPMARIDGDVSWVVLPSPLSSDSNERSLVVRLCHGRVCALLVGDAEAEREAALLAWGGPLRAAYLKVGHHGSTTSTSDALVDAVRPRIAVVHVGRRNRYNHPSALVLERLAAAGARLERTDRGAAIVFATDGRRGWIERGDRRR